MCVSCVPTGCFLFLILFGEARGQEGKRCLSRSLSWLLPSLCGSLTFIIVTFAPFLSFSSFSASPPLPSPSLSCVKNACVWRGRGGEGGGGASALHLDLHLFSFIWSRVCSSLLAYCVCVRASPLYARSPTLSLDAFLCHNTKTQNLQCLCILQQYDPLPLPLPSIPPTRTHRCIQAYTPSNHAWMNPKHRRREKRNAKASLLSSFSYHHHPLHTRACVCRVIDNSRSFRKHAEANTFPFFFLFFRFCV